MTPVEFAGQNGVAGKDQPEYLPLPMHVAQDGTLTTCWGLTDEEKAEVARTGQIWVQTLTFGGPVTPMMLYAQRPDGVPLP